MFRDELRCLLGNDRPDRAFCFSVARLLFLFVTVGGGVVFVGGDIVAGIRNRLIDLYRAKSRTKRLLFNFM